MPPIELRDRPIVISGASAGIGRATALRCARAGMPVVVSARRADRLEETVAAIRAEGGRAVAAEADVRDPASCERVIARCVDAFGSIYAVFANAGYGVECAIHEMSDRAMRDIFETNFFGALNTIRPAIPRMVERSDGHVLICSSCVAKFALPYYGAYSATKAAQNHIGRAMRMELAPLGVHVSTVHPVGTRTEFFEVARAGSGDAPLIAHAPRALMQSPETVARAIVRCLRRPRPEVWTSRLVRIGMAVGAAFPRLADMGVRGHVRQRRRNEATRPSQPAASVSATGTRPASTAPR